jgi:hypothetical protein
MHDDEVYEDSPHHDMILYEDPYYDMHEAPHHEITIFETSHDVFIEFWSEFHITIFEISHCMYFEIFSDMRTIVCMFSSRYLDISLAKKKLQYLQ